MIIQSFIDKVCDGIVHCLYGEDEEDATCENQLKFSEAATVECIENRLNYDLKIKAFPCNGIKECRDNSDEDCENKKWILYSILIALGVITNIVYYYMKWYSLDWKNASENIPEIKRDDGWDSKICINFKGEKLANLKVYLFH